MLHFSLNSIGFVESCFPTRFGVPRQGGLAPHAWGIIHLRPELNLTDALDGLQDFSHLWVVFIFHKNENRRSLTKVSPPRLGGKKIGVLASRTPHRPNPIGLSVVKLERVEGNKIYISGVDILDGSPVLDIKPYVAFSDSIPDAKSAWAPAAPEISLNVVISARAEEELRVLKTDCPEKIPALRSLIKETVCLDPRATFLKGDAESPNPYTDLYGLFIEDLNVLFKIVGNEAEIVRIEPASVHKKPLRSR